MSAVLPPLDGSLTVGEIIDFHLQYGSRSSAYAFPDADGHVTEISHFEFARAAHRAAHLLRPQRQGPEEQVVGIVAVTDVLLYQTIFAGCLKAGIIPFPISHRNSEAAILHLITSTSVHRLLTTHGSISRMVEGLSAEASARSPPHGLLIEEIPLLGQLYPHLGRETRNDSFVPYPSPATSTPLDTIAVYMHSSGSTGFPKPIPWTHRTVITFSALDVATETAQYSPRHAVGALPAFHALGIFTQFITPIMNGGTACIYPPASTATEYQIPVNPTAENALENAKRVGATGITTVPAFLMEWQGPEDVEYLKTLDLVAFSGGPLAPRVGDYLFHQGVRLTPLYGGTEFGIISTFRKTEYEASEWFWLKFSPRVNVRWVPVDNTFECQLLTTPTHRLAVENLDDVRGYSTKDLFERHPTKLNLYRIVSRLDDVIIMANGEKTVPGPMEDMMTASPYIAGAVMFGRERNQVGVLFEPSPQYALDPKDEQALAKFRNLVWSAVEEANEHAPAFARIYKEMILVTHPGRPMARAPKKTIIKKSTIALYTQEIENLYNIIEASGKAAGDIEPPASWSAADLEPWLITHARLLSSKNVSVGVDLFDQGFDSLNATFLRHRIVGALKNAADDSLKAAARKVPQNFVYSHPEIGELAHAISRLVRGDADEVGDNTGKKAAVEAMIAKYSKGFEQSIPQAQVAGTTGGAVVLLTGSTGGLGSHILEILLGSKAVERVYAFNRKGRTSIADRQREAFADRALDVDLLSSKKLVYIEGDSSQDDLGLPSDVGMKLRDTITVVIHNAWVLDFNKALSTFEPHVRGTYNLINLARSSPRASQVRFLFTSSIASALGWDQKRGPVPEELQLDAAVAIGSGYGESKYATERILAVSGLQATSFRIGQVSGSNSNGAWSTSDWVPALVKSSIALGNFPADPSGTVAWLTPEAVSQTIVDVGLRKETSPFAINLVHPRPVSWDGVMSSLAGVAQLPLVPMPEWVEQLESRAASASAEDIDKIPGIKLLDFFRGAATGTGNLPFSTLKAQAISDSMRLLNSLSAADAQRWMRYWKDVGFLN